MSEQDKRIQTKEADAAQAGVMRLDQQAFNAHYRLNPKVKQKPGLREENVLLSVRHL